MPSSRTAALTLIAVLMTLTIGCAGLQPGYETPSVTISSFKALPGEGVAPRFEIGLHIVNPNRTELALKGVAYTVSLEGHKVLTGVANDLPVIEAYGEGNVLLMGTVSLFDSIAFFTDLARKGNPEELSYSLDAKLDPGTLSPVIRVNKEGKISLGQDQ